MLDLHTGVFRAPERRIIAFQSHLQSIVDSRFSVSALLQAKVTKSLVSMGLALGLVVRVCMDTVYLQRNCTEREREYWDTWFVLGARDERQLES